MSTAKKRDDSHRFRNITICFRTTADEKKEIFDAIRLSGLSKQHYILSKLTDRTVNVMPNPRVYKAIMENFGAMLPELKNAESIDDLEPLTKKNLEFLTHILNEMRGSGNDC